MVRRGEAGDKEFSGGAGELELEEGDLEEEGRRSSGRRGVGEE